jgi:uncharacterized protein YbaR (Trm112 family)
MHPDLIPRLRCPVCRGVLDVVEIEEVVGVEIEVGTLACTSCGTHYPIERGVPFVLTPDVRADLDERVGAQAESELEAYRTAATPAIARYLGKLARSADVVLDIGSGRSPYRHLFRGELICVDLFPAFLYDLQATAVDNLRVHAVCASAINLPFEEGVADLVFASEVIEHLAPKDAEAAMHTWPRFARKWCVIDTLNGHERSLIARLRHLLYRTEDMTPIYHPELRELDHHSTFSPDDFRAAGYRCHGCIGWVSRRRFRLGPLWDLYDALAWRVPAVGGTLVAVKPGLEESRSATV